MKRKAAWLLSVTVMGAVAILAAPLARLPASPGTQAASSSSQTASNGTISGIVTDDDSTPLVGIGVGAGDYDTIVGCGGADHWTGTASDGLFQLDVPPGTYLVFVNSHPYPGSYLPEAYSNQQVTVQADVTATVDLALMPWAATVYLPLIVHWSQVKDPMNLSSETERVVTVDAPVCV